MMFLIYSLTFHLTNKHNVAVADHNLINGFMKEGDLKWINFFNKISVEKGLTPYPFLNLKEKWLNGKATIVINERFDIISYLSLNHFDLKILIPGFDYNVYESATGWTQSSYRNMGINFIIRKKLIDTYKGERSLFFSFTRGKGAGTLLRKLEWKLILWKKYPFSSAFIGWFTENNLFYKSAYGAKEELGHLDNYDVNDLNYNDDSMYLWVSYLKLLEHIENRLRNYFKDLNILHSQIIILKGN